jgi:L-lactate dehydrogenase complex protein LldG
MNLQKTMEFPMSDSARAHILDQLRQATAAPGRSQPIAEAIQPKRYPPGRRVERLKRLMEAVRTEVHLSTADAWVDDLLEIVQRKNIRSLLYAPGTDIGNEIAEAWPAGHGQAAELRPYERDIESFKAELFAIDAAITGTRGAIAETGALILWPTPEEPRLISLVPPIHIAVLRADKIHDTFADVISSEKWADRMPTNALLISGPSKTADIEMTLAFGVHGPKELVVILINDP